MTKNGQSMGQLTERLAKVEQQFRLRAITPEFEILLQLYEKGRRLQPRFVPPPAPLRPRSASS
jgi:hypothetical protein